MEHFLDNLAKNWGAYSAAAGVLFVAFVSTMPKDPPSNFAVYWTWVRSALQTAIPAARHPEPEFPPANPSQPDGPAPTQK